MVGDNTLNSYSKKLDLAICVVVNGVFEKFKELCKNLYIGHSGEVSKIDTAKLSKIDIGNLPQIELSKFFLKYETPMKKKETLIKNDETKEFYTICPFITG